MKLNTRHSYERSILYRPDIDGLRAIAVLSVIIFHIWPRLLSGGFVGVDIFFVISGFLITSIINKELTDGTFTFSRFYTRRIKRILPAFYLVLLFISIVAYFILLPGTDYTFFAKTVLSACMYISNMYFARNNNYFSPNTHEYPLLHTWSLSVEEQYYAFWPLVLFLLFKFNKSRWARFFIISTLFVLSYLFSIYCIKHNVIFGYYSIFSRTFELMIGAIVSIMVFGINHDNKYSNFQSQFSANVLLSNFLSCIGFILLVLSIIFLNDKHPFPGFIALIPTMGAALIIYAGCISHKNFINKIMSTKPFVAFGVLSYSLYLWHWPLLAFWHYYNYGQNITLIDGMLVIIFTIGLSTFSYFFIEKPVKYKKYTFKQAFIKLQLIPIILAISLSGIIIKTHGIPGRVDAKLQKETLFLSDKYCFGYVRGDCIIGDKSQHPPKVILFGDSHAAALFPFWDEVARNYHFSIKAVAIGSCYPLINSKDDLPATDKKMVLSRCPNQVRYVTNHINDYEVFILSASWSNYLLNGLWQPSDFVFTDEIKNTLEFLQEHNKKVIIMGDIPVSDKNQITNLLRHNAVKWSFLKNNTKDIKMIIPVKENKMIKDISDHYSNVYYFDTSRAMFTAVKDFPYFNGILMYKDDAHLNQYGSQEFAKLYLNNSQSKDLKDKLNGYGLISPVK